MEARLTSQGVCRFKSCSYRQGSFGHLESPSRSKRDVPSGLARSTRALSAKCGCVGATGLPYRAVNPELFRALKVRILPHPPAFACSAGFDSAGPVDGEGCRAVASAEADTYECPAAARYSLARASSQPWQFQFRSRSLIGQSSRLSIEQMPVRIRSAAPTVLHAVG